MPCAFKRVPDTAEEIRKAFSPPICERVMPARINVLQWIVIAIAIPIETLRVPIVRHNRIRAYKPANRRIIIAGVVVVQAGIVQPLAGEQLVRIQRAGCGAGGSVRHIFDGGGGGEGGAA